MPTQPNWTNGLGFRHLIEDGMTILQDRPIASDRRKYVLDNLSELVLQAQRGSNLVRNHTLFVASADRNAVESFSVFDRFLDDAESDHWQAVFGQAEQALNALRTGQVPQNQWREVALSLFQRILSGLIREPKPGIPTEPEEIRIGR